MARKFLVSLDLNKNELLNARLQNLSSDPSSPVAGQIYYNTVDKVTKFYDGTQWVAGGSTKFGLQSNRPSASKGGTLYAATDTSTLFLDNGTSWIQIGINPEDLSDAINALTTDDIEEGSTNLYFTNERAQDAVGNAVGTGLTYTDSTGEIKVTPNTYDAYGAASDVQDNLDSHTSLSSGVHGVTGTVVGTTDTQDLSNKRFIDTVYFTDGVTINNEGEIAIRSGNHDFDVQANYGDLNLKSTSGDVNVTSTNGDIVLNPDGNVFLWSKTNDNQVVTFGDLNSDAVIQSVSGTTNQIVSNNTAGDITLSFPAELHIKKTSNGYAAIILDADEGKITLNDQVAETKVLDIYNSDGNAVLSSQYSFNIESGNGDIGLNPDGEVNIYSQLNVDGNLNTTNIVGQTDGSADGSLTIKDGTGTSEIHINGISKNIELLPAPGSKAFYGSSATAGNEIAKISDIQASSSGLSWKQAVNLFADSNVSLTGAHDTLVIDGHDALGIADKGAYRILLTAQSTDSENGIYVYNDAGSGNYQLDRATDADAYTELVGAALFVMEGTNYASTSWVQADHYLTGFAGQNWVQFSGQGTYTPSDSIFISGRSINVAVDSTRGIDVDGDGVYAKIGNGIEFDGSGNIAINAGTGFDISSGTLEFASSYGVRKYAESIGDNSATTFTITHNFDTKDVTVQIFENGASHAQIEADVEHSTTSAVTIKFASAPDTDEYRVVIVG